MSTKKVPYLSIAVTNVCNFKCTYCSPDGQSENGVGEAFGTATEEVDMNDLARKVKIAEEEGVQRIRVTGGEPLVVKGLFDFLRDIDKNTNLEMALATNGALVHRHIEDILSIPKLDVRISLDSLDPEKFQDICQVSEKMYKQTMDNIKLLASMGRLTRVAGVVTNDNVDDIEKLVDFVEDLGINLKLFDMYATPTMNNWDKQYTHLKEIKKRLGERSIGVRQIGYTTSFGIPSLEYISEKGSLIRVKDSINGTRYNDELCDSCEHMPCQEGLYTILYSSNKKLIPCRMSPEHFDGATDEDFRGNLRFLIGLFQNSYHSNKFWDINNKTGDKK